LTFNHSLNKKALSLFLTITFTTSTTFAWSPDVGTVASVLGAAGIVVVGITSAAIGFTNLIVVEHHRFVSGGQQVLLKTQYTEHGATLLGKFRAYGTTYVYFPWEVILLLYKYPELRDVYWGLKHVDFNDVYGKADEEIIKKFGSKFDGRTLMLLQTLQDILIQEGFEFENSEEPTTQNSPSLIAIGIARTTWKKFQKLKPEEFDELLPSDLY